VAQKFHFAIANRSNSCIARSLCDSGSIVVNAAVVGDIHYANSRRLSNEDFWKINLVFWKL